MGQAKRMLEEQEQKRQNKLNGYRKKLVHFKNYIRSTISPHCGTSNYWRADLSNLI